MKLTLFHYNYLYICGADPSTSKASRSSSTAIHEVQSKDMGTAQGRWKESLGGNIFSNKTGHTHVSISIHTVPMYIRVYIV